MAENKELVSSEGERTLGSPKVDSDCTPGKTAKGSGSRMVTNGQEEAVQWVWLPEVQPLTRPTSSNGPVLYFVEKCSQRYPQSCPQVLWIHNVMWQRQIKVVDKIKVDNRLTSRWGDSPALSRWAQHNQKGLQKQKGEREEREPGRWQHDQRSGQTLLAWRRKMGIMSQGPWMASRRWKKQWDRPFPSAFRRKAALPNPNF